MPVRDPSPVRAGGAPRRVGGGGSAPPGRRAPPWRRRSDPRPAVAGRVDRAHAPVG